MTLYLSTDGVDDLFKTPSGIPIKKVVAIIQLDNTQPKATPTLFDSRNAGFLATWDPIKKEVGFVTAGSTILINGVSTITLPMDTKFELTHTYNSQITTDTNGLRVFADRAGASASFTKGRIYNVKMYDSSSNLVAHYDMSTGTVQDQSGNGRHATLTGGTWLDDGVGGTPTGTDGSSAFDLRQNLYADSSVQTDTKQAIYSDSTSGYDTRLTLYQDGALTFDTLQEFFSDGIVGSTPFDLRFILYADNSAVYDSMQAWYSDGISSADLAHQFYQAGATNADMKLVIYADALSKFDASQSLYSDSFAKADTAQHYYAEGFADFDTLQAILDDWAQYNEVIRIVLNITRKQATTLDITQRKQSELKL